MNQQILAVAASSSGTLGSAWLPGIILAQLYILVFVYLAWSARQLPARVATHFGLLGRPDGYMTRTGYLIFIAAFAVIFPQIGLIIHFVTLNHPESVHVAHREYWLAPEHLAETQAYMLQHWLWFACLLSGFATGLHFVILRANRRVPPRLPWLPLLALLAYLLGGVIWWATDLQRHFSHI